MVWELVVSSGLLGGVVALWSVRDRYDMIWHPVSDESEIGGLNWAGLGCKVGATGISERESHGSLSY